jgi:hypothetical protein
MEYHTTSIVGLVCFQVVSHCALGRPAHPFVNYEAYLLGKIEESEGKLLCHDRNAVVLRMFQSELERGELRSSLLETTSLAAENFWIFLLSRAKISCIGVVYVVGQEQSSHVCC